MTDDQLDHAPAADSPRRGRALALVAVGASLVGAAFVVLGVRGAASDDDTVVLDVEPAVAAAPPSTVAPIEVPAIDPPVAAPQRVDGGDTPRDGTAAGDDAGSRASAASGEAGAEPELADLVGERYSVIPPAIEPRPRPVGLEIDSIDVSGFPVRDIGLEPDGQMEIPDETEIGWYRYGATAGRPGATVLAAHVSWNRTVGPFAQLGAVDPGDRIAVTLDDGTTRHYEVTERAMYGKLELPRERLWRNSGAEELVLITCGGDFNPDIRRYQQNIVVYAVPVA